MKLFKNKKEQSNQLRQEVSNEAVKALITGKWKHTREENNAKMREAYRLEKEYITENLDEIVDAIEIPVSKIEAVLTEYINSSLDQQGIILEKQISHFNHQYKIYEKDYNKENVALNKAVDLQQEGKILEKKSIDKALECYMRSIDYYPTPNALKRCVILYNKKKEFMKSLFFCEIAININFIINNPGKMNQEYFIQRKEKLLKKIVKNK